MVETVAGQGETVVVLVVMVAEMVARTVVVKDQMVDREELEVQV